MKPNGDESVVVEPSRGRMDSMMTMNRSDGRPFRGAIPLLLLGTLFNFGCPSMSTYVRSKMPFLAEEYALAPESSLTEIVSHLNRTSAQVDSWRSTDARLQISGVGKMFPLSAMMAVEEPSRLRLVVTNGLDGQHEVDLGSNDDRFWFWARPRGEGVKNVLTVSHNELTKMKHELPFPVEPRWLMEVLGVTEYDAAKLRLEKNSNVLHLVNLVSVDSSTGPPGLKRITEVDLRDGRVSAHRLIGPNGQLVAEAKLTEYRKSPIDGVYLPHKMKLNWPEMDKQLTISLKSMEVNPQAMSGEIWNVPDIRDCPVRELTAAHFRRPRNELEQPVHGATGGQHPRMVSEYEIDPQRNVKSHHEIRNESVQPAGHVKLDFEAGSEATPTFRQSFTEPRQGERDSGVPPEWQQQPAPSSQKKETRSTGGLPEWARDFPDQSALPAAGQTPSSHSASGQPSTYSEATSPESSGRLRQEQELSPWQ